MKDKKIYCFDLDETLCSKAIDGNYATAQPFEKAINKVNELFEEGNTILIFTGRGSSSGKNWEELTTKQLNEWNVKHHKLIMNKKPTYDIIIDDKAINAEEWRRKNCGIKGVLAGAFDIIHPGYCKMLAEAKKHCDHLTVLLHDDPSIENKKLKPVQTVKERKEILQSIKWVDDIIIYKNENELLYFLNNNEFDVRFLGDDYKDKQFTGHDLHLKIIFIDRSHNYSTTKLKKQIFESIKNEN